MGAAFSLFSNATPFLGLLSLIVSVGLIFWLWRFSQISIWQSLAIAFLLGGSLGNGLDRWFLGYVIDFIEIVPFNFPIFNFADIAINLGVLFFVIDICNKYFSGFTFKYSISLVERKSHFNLFQRPI